MKTKKYVTLALLGLVSMQFGAVGLLKIGSFGPLYGQLAALHINHTGGLLIGIAEVLGVIGLWVRPTRRLALLGLLMLAVGAIAVHVGAVQPLSAMIPAILSTVGLLTLLYLTNPAALVGESNLG